MEKNSEQPILSLYSKEQLGSLQSDLMIDDRAYPKLITVFPANVYMAQNPHLFPDISPTALLIRLPLQLVPILWAWWATKPDPNTGFDTSPKRQ